MSLSSREQWHARKTYYHKVLGPVASQVLTRLATLDGAFAMENREMAPRFEIEEETQEPEKKKVKVKKSVMSRFRSFGKWADVSTYLCNKAPSTLQFGAIYPSTVRTEESRAHAKATGLMFYGELVIDVDLTDYDRTGICECKDKKQACNDCWHVFMEPGRKALDYILKEVMGFRAVFYVFSGRRGYHAWVLDRQILTWTPQVRRNLVTRMAKMMVDGEPAADMVFDILQPTFNKYFWPDLAPLYASYPPPELRAQHRKMLFERLYPKLDVGVSDQQNHLHKLPFFPHQTTGFVSIPLPVVDLGYKFCLENHRIHYSDMTAEKLKFFLKPVERALNMIKDT